VDCGFEALSLTSLFFVRLRLDFLQSEVTREGGAKEMNNKEFGTN